MTRATWRPIAAFRVAATLLVLALARGPSPLVMFGQEAPGEPADSAAAEDTTRGGAVTPAEAEAIRDTLQRPPAQYSADWVDVVEFPLKVIGWPLGHIYCGFIAGSSITRFSMTSRLFSLNSPRRATQN